VCISVSACVRIASTTFGWQCPQTFTATPAMQSMYSLPSESQTRAPLPRVKVMGWRVYVGWIYLASASMRVMSRSLYVFCAYNSRGRFLQSCINYWNIFIIINRSKIYQQPRYETNDYHQDKNTDTPFIFRVENRIVNCFG